MAIPAQPALDRLLAKVRYDRGCWEFTGARNALGYGYLNNPSGSMLTHRIVYEALVGPVSSSIALDHLCRNPSCCNPLHLEPVSMRENLARGADSSAYQKRKTHCPKGHEYTPENTRLKDGRRRECRQCGRDYEKRKKENARCRPQA